MSKNYYDKILEQINNLIDKKKYQKAQTIIDDELNLPYIPFQVESQLLILKDKLNDFSNSNRNNIEIEKLINLIENNNISNEEKYEIIELFSNFDLKKSLTQIVNLLQLDNEKLKFVIKARIINQLLLQKISETIFYKNSKNKLISFDLSKSTSLYDESFFAKESSEIEKYLFKNPNAANVAFIFLENYFFSLFLIDDNKTHFNNNDSYDGIGFACCLISLKILKQQEEFVNLYKESRFENKKLNELIFEISKKLDIK